MSYLPPWAPTSGGGPYPPHMLPPHHSPTSSQHPSTTQAQSSQNSAQVPTSTSVYQNLSPVVKNTSTTSTATSQSSETTKSHVSSPSSVSSPITSASNAASSGSIGPSSSSSSTSSVALGDPYQPQGFQRSESPPLKRPVLPDAIKGEGHGLDAPTDMILGIPGPSALDFKSRK